MVGFDLDQTVTLNVFGDVCGLFFGWIVPFRVRFGPSGFLNFHPSILHLMVQFHQSPVTSIITTLLTAFTSFGLAAVSLW